MLLRGGVFTRAVTRTTCLQYFRNVAYQNELGSSHVKGCRTKGVFRYLITASGFR